MYSPIIPSIKNKAEFNSKNTPTILPKPANGTPFVNQIIDRGIRIEIDKSARAKPVKVIKRNGLMECANIPLNARSNTMNVLALDTPPNLGGRSIGIPIDLKPDHAKSPRTNRFLSCMFLIAW